MNFLIHSDFEKKNKIKYLTPFLLTLSVFAMLGITACDRQKEDPAALYDKAQTSETMRPDSIPSTPLVSGLPDFTRLVEKVSPSVVNISTTSEMTSASRRADPDSPEEFFKRFFGEEPSMPPNEGRGGAEETDSLGSGFIVSEDGKILTNYHVVRGAKKIYVKLNDRRQLPAKVLGTDEKSDLALLKIEATDLPKVRIGSSDKLKVGSWVVAIGSPFGFDYSVTSGIVSAKSRSLQNDQYVPFIQTDVAINPGNSGGPLFNLNGEVVGINSQIYSRTGGYMGVAFAIPIDLAADIVRQLEVNGKVMRGMIGVVVQEVDMNLAKALGMKKPEGALVNRISPQSPAAKAGIKAGDVLLEYDGKLVTQSAMLPVLVGVSAPGKSVTVKLLRAGKVLTVNLVVASLPSEMAAVEPEPEPEVDTRLGLVITEIEPSTRERLQLEAGVLVRKILPNTPASRSELAAGDIVLSIANTVVQSADDFETLEKSLPKGATVPILIQRGDQRQFVPLDLS